MKFLSPCTHTTFNIGRTNPLNICDQCSYRPESMTKCDWTSSILRAQFPDPIYCTVTKGTLTHWMGINSYPQLEVSHDILNVGLWTMPSPGVISFLVFQCYIISPVKVQKPKYTIISSSCIQFNKVKCRNVLWIGVKELWLCSIKYITSSKWLQCQGRFHLTNDARYCPIWWV